MLRLDLTSKNVYERLMRFRSVALILGVGGAKFTLLYAACLADERNFIIRYEPRRWATVVSRTNNIPLL